ncbi:hypothetical protein Tco_0252336 [Tanacetum coccineum]
MLQETKVIHGLMLKSGFLDSGRGGEKKKKKKGTGMESNTSKLASNFNDESVVPIEKPIDIPNFTIEEVVVGSNVTSQHSETTTHGKNTVTPKPTKATCLSSTSTSGMINYTTGQMCSSSLNLNVIAKKVGDQEVEPINECPSIYATKLSLTSSIMATLRKLDANLLNNTDYDILLPKASVHEVNDGMKNLLYGYFIGKRLAFPIVECEGPGYTKETIHVEYEWEHPRCSMCLLFGHLLDDYLKVPKRKKSGHNGGTINFKPVLVKPETQYIPKVNLTNTKVFPKTASTVGKKNGSPSGNSSEKTNMPNATTSGNGIFPLLLEEKCVLVDEDGKPLEKVDYSGDHGSEDDFAHVDNEMASFLAKTSGVAYGTKSMLEQWRKTYGDVEQE